MLGRREVEGGGEAITEARFMGRIDVGWEAGQRKVGEEVMHV